MIRYLDGWAREGMEGAARARPVVKTNLIELVDVSYYNHDRPHRTLALEAPVPRSVLNAGRVVSRPILGGLHHAYSRAA
jgi:hypothetical protein